jgi:hypothetical protein
MTRRPPRRPALRLPARDHLESPNLVARLNLPNMAYAPEDKLLVYAQAQRGLMALEPSLEKQLKYLDFIDIYADLDDNERQRYTQLYPHEVNAMTGFAQRFRDEGREEGRQEGRQEGQQEGLQKGESAILLRLIQLKFGPPDAAIRHRVESAPADTLLSWAERILTATSMDELFRHP